MIEGDYDGTRKEKNLGERRMRQRGKGRVGDRRFEEKKGWKKLEWKKSDICAIFKKCVP